MATQAIAVDNPRLQLGAFEEFVKLVSNRSSGGPFVASLRETLDPFLVSPKDYQSHVDALLAVYSVAWLGARYPWTQRMLRKVLRRRADSLPNLAMSDTQQVREVLKELDGALADPSSELYPDPRRFRRALDVFMLSPTRDSRHVDRIVDAYAASFLASQFLLARPMLGKLMSKASRNEAAELASLTTELKSRASGRPPVAVVAGFLPVEPLESKASDTSLFRRMAVGLWLHITPDDGYRLQTVSLELIFQESVQVYGATASALRDGGEAEVTLKTEMSSTLSRARTFSAGAKTGIPLGPVQPSAGFDFSVGRRSEDTETEAVNEDHSKIAITAVPLDETARLNLRVPERYRHAPGAGGLPLGVTLMLNVRVPATDQALNAKLRCAVRAGSLDVSSEQAETILLPEVPES